MSLSLLVHALLLWAEPVGAPTGPGAADGRALKVRLVAAQPAQTESVPAVLPVVNGVAVAAAEAPATEPVTGPAAEAPAPAPAAPAPEARTAPLPEVPPLQPPPSAPAGGEPEASAASAASASAPPAEAAGAFQVPLPGQPEFLPARMLDVLPQPAEAVALEYPDAAGMGRSGVVTLLLLIDEFGVVVETKVLDSNPEGVFDTFASEVFRTTRFVPGQRNGRPVRSRLVVEVSFDAGASSRRAP